MRVPAVIVKDSVGNFNFCSDKAVAVGAVSFHIDHFVKGRLSRFTYGTPHCTLYKTSDPEHVKREDKTFISLLGLKYVPDAFSSMLPKV